LKIYHLATLLVTLRCRVVVFLGSAAVCIIFPRTEMVDIIRVDVARVWEGVGPDGNCGGNPFL
jgi:hypothetical protein